jgi:Fe-S cluster biogenesis protein NfuA
MAAAEELQEQVARFLAEEAGPSLGLDGGTLEVVEISEGVARVRLGGSCASCPVTIMTVISGIEQQVRRRFPEIDFIEVLP